MSEDDLHELLYTLQTLDVPREDQAERLILELSRQFDRINDHLAGMERALSFMADNAPVTEFRRDHGHGRDRP